MDRFPAAPLGVEWHSKKLSSHRDSHGFTNKSQNAFVCCVSLHSSSPESCDLWYKSGGSTETIWSETPMALQKPVAAESPIAVD